MDDLGGSNCHKAPTLSNTFSWLDEYHCSFRQQFWRDILWIYPPAMVANKVSMMFLDFPMRSFNVIARINNSTEVIADIGPHGFFLRKTGNPEQKLIFIFFTDNVETFFFCAFRKNSTLRNQHRTFNSSLQPGSYPSRHFICILKTTQRKPFNF